MKECKVRGESFLDKSDKHHWAKQRARRAREGRGGGVALKRDPSPACSLIRPRSEVRGLCPWVDLVPSGPMGQRRRVGVKGWRAGEGDGSV